MFDIHRYYNRFNDAKAPRTPNFNVQSSDKHPMVAENPILNETAIEWIDQLYRYVILFIVLLSCYHICEYL